MNNYKPAILRKASVGDTDDYGNLDVVGKYCRTSDRTDEPVPIVTKGTMERVLTTLWLETILYFPTYLYANRELYPTPHVYLHNTHMFICLVV